MGILEESARIDVLDGVCQHINGRTDTSRPWREPLWENGGKVHGFLVTSLYLRIMTIYNHNK
jgi:hypothetical protein